MSQLAEEFERAWGRFRIAFETGDDEGSLGALQAWITAWDECVQAGETDRFMGSGRFRARGRYSGLVMRFPLAVVWTYRDGRISRVEAYGTRRRARGELLATPAAV